MTQLSQDSCYITITNGSMVEDLMVTSKMMEAVTMTNNFVKTFGASNLENELKHLCCKRGSTNYIDYTNRFAEKMMVEEEDEEKEKNTDEIKSEIINKPKIEEIEKGLMFKDKEVMNKFQYKVYKS